MGWGAITAISATVCHSRAILSRLTSKAAVILILLGFLVVLGALTNPLAISMATGTLLIGVVIIAIASFAGL